MPDFKALSKKLAEVIPEEKLLEFAQERTERLQQEITPEMTTEDISLRCYIQGFIDAAFAAIDKYEPREVKQ